MSVYIDDFNARFGRMRMCHMVADTHEELIAMADKIGVQRKWLQKPGTSHEHFDVCLSKRQLAIENGAVPVSVVDIAKLCMKRRERLKEMEK